MKNKNNKLKTKMAELGISNLELCEKTGLSKEYISKLRNHKINPTLATLQKIADALGCDVKEII